MSDLTPTGHPGAAICTPGAPISIATGDVGTLSPPGAGGPWGWAVVTNSSPWLVVVVGPKTLQPWSTDLVQLLGQSLPYSVSTPPAGSVTPPDGAAIYLQADWYPARAVPPSGTWPLALTAQAVAFALAAQVKTQQFVVSPEIQGPGTSGDIGVDLSTDPPTVTSGAAGTVNPYPAGLSAANFTSLLVTCQIATPSDPTGIVISLLQQNDAGQWQIDKTVQQNSKSVTFLVPLLLSDSPTNPTGFSLFSSVTATYSISVMLVQDPIATAVTVAAIDQAAGFLPVGGMNGFTTLPAFIQLDANNSQLVAGEAAEGTPAEGPPVRVAGWDGTNVRTLSTDASGHSLVVGTTAPAAGLIGNPVPVAGTDALTGVHPFHTDTHGGLYPAASSSGATTIGVGLTAASTTPFGPNGAGTIILEMQLLVQAGTVTSLGYVELVDQGSGDVLCHVFLSQSNAVFPLVLSVPHILQPGATTGLALVVGPGISTTGRAVATVRW